MYEFLLLSAFSASTFTLGKKVLLYTTPTFLTGVRLIIAGFIFLALHAIRYGFADILKNVRWWLLIKIALFGFAVGYILEFWALQYMISSKAALLASFAPVLAAILSYFSFKEIVTPKKVLGLLISVLGFVPELVISAWGEGPTIFFISWPEVALFAAVASFSYGWILIRTAIKQYNMPITLINGMSMSMAGIAALAFSLVEPARVPFLNTWNIPVTNIALFIGYTAGLIIIGNIICYFLYGFLLQKYTTTMLTFGELLTPVFAAFYGWLFLSESVQWPFFVSLATIMVGVFLYYSEERRLGYIK